MCNVNENTQYVQLEKQEGSNQSNADDNYSYETKSQFTDRVLEFGQKRSKSIGSKIHNEFVTENLDAKIAQHIL